MSRPKATDFHGTVKGYTHYRCRCEECKSAKADYDQRRRTRCGTVYRYRTGCRCAECVDAMQAQGRRRRRGLEPDDPRHGTRNAYSHHGCRCEPCTLASSNYKKGLPEMSGQSPRPGVNSVIPLPRLLHAGTCATDPMAPTIIEMYAEIAAVQEAAATWCTTSKCPVISECLAYAMAAGAQEWGVWGGTTENQRAEMRRAAAEAVTA